MKNQKANLVLLAGVVFLLAVGVLYAWSVLKIQLIAPIDEGGWGWEAKAAGLPYTLAIVCFAIAVLVGGRIQDKIGPRWVVTTGGVFVGLGLIFSGLVGNSVIGLALCFGVFVGAGIGLGYGCAAPPAFKWFHPSKRGLISGLIVGGFGLAPVYIAPLMNFLLSNFGIEKALIYLGAASLFISVPIAQLIRNPPEGYTPPVPKNMKPSVAAKKAPLDVPWNEMLKTKQFYLMFFMFLISASVGLMIIGNMTKIAHIQIGIDNTAFLALLVSLLAITNMVGRVLGGSLSDKIGRVNTLFLVFGLQAINMVGFMLYQSLPGLILGIVIVGCSFGAGLSIFPPTTADLYGLKNYGTNYGIVYLAWGVAGAVAPVIADFIYDAHGNFEIAYVFSAIAMTFLLGVNVIFKKVVESRARI
jgi:MFS family permease